VLHKSFAYDKQPSSEAIFLDANDMILILLFSVQSKTITLPLSPITVAGLPFQKRMLFGSLTWLWTKGVTPGDLVRGFGPVGMYIHLDTCMSYTMVYI
jgi:hypothetical protein